MVKYAKSEYPALTFKQGSPLTTNIFNENSFTHILCLNMNFYYYKDKKLFFQNVYDWLMPGGYFVVQLVDKNKFDPVVPAAKPFVMINPQSVAEKRITESAVVFNNFDYTADFQIFPNDFACLGASTFSPQMSYINKYVTSPPLPDPRDTVIREVLLEISLSTRPGITSASTEKAPAFSNLLNF